MRNAEIQMELLECLVGILIPLFVIYKLIDHLIRWPTIGQYADRYILVTGCDTGFGYAIARRLDKLGCHVFAACLTEAGQLKLAGTCSERMHALIMDVTNHDSILWAYDNVKSRLPVGKGLWAVLNNAGVGAGGPIEWLTVDDYKMTSSVNLFGLIDVTMTFLPLVKKSRGRVVNVSSMAGRVSLPYAAPYSVSKFGVEAFTDNLRRSLNPYKCKAIVIEPGGFRTEAVDTEKIEADVVALWRRTSPEVKEAFGDEYFRAYVKGIVDGMQKMCAASIDPVIDAYQHALLGRFPRPRYIVGYDAKLIFLPLSYLPDWIADGFLHLSMGRWFPLPAALKKSKID